MNTQLPTVTGYGKYSSENYGVNSLRVDVGELTLWFSYQTPVAFQLTGQTKFVRQNDWGVTTGKHLNWIDGGDKKSRVTGDVFEQKFQATLKMLNLEGSA